MKSYVVVEVNENMAWASTIQGDEPGVEEPIVLDWDMLEDCFEAEVLDSLLDEYEAAILSLPESATRRDLLATIMLERAR